MKQLYKRILLVVAFLLLTTMSFGQMIDNPEFDDPDFFYMVGEFNKQIPNTYGTKVHVIGYVRRTLVSSEREYQQQQQEKILFAPNKYRYELIVISKSTFQNELTSTWLYGVDLIINGQNIVANEYPNDNYNLLIRTTPIKPVFWRETSEEMILIEISWNNAIYDPRKVK